MQNARTFLTRVMRFAAVGVMATLMYAALAFGLEASGMAVFHAHGIASGISLIASYLGQKIFTFGVRSQYRKTGLRFAAATAFLVCAQTAIVLLLDQFGSSPGLILLTSTLFYPPASFLLHNFWTFRTPRPAAQQPLERSG